MMLRSLLKKVVARTQKLPYTQIINKLSSETPQALFDIGAHMGRFTKAISSQKNFDKYILVEPIKKNFEFLKEEFKSKKYEVINKAVSDVSGESVDFNINDFDETSSLLKFKNSLPELSNIKTDLKKTVKIESITIDNIVNQYKIPFIGLMKIDVQGIEDRVLKGAKKSLSSTDLIWIETSLKQLYEESATFPHIYDILTQSNFRLLEINPGHRSSKGEILQLDLLFKNNRL